jgi:predicted MFS family arabinose efflux permease
MPSLRRNINLHIFLFALTRTIINTSYRMVYPFLPIFAQCLGIQPAAFGMALSIRSFLGIFGPFLATVADTHDRKTGMLLGLGLFTLGSGVVVIWPTFWVFIIGTSLVLLGNGVFIPSMNAYLGDRIPYERRGRVLAITEVSWALAFIVGIPAVRALLESYSWITPFILFTLIGLALFSIIAWSLPRQNIMRSEGNTLWQNLSRILRTWPALAGLLAGILFTSANEVINLVFGLWIGGQFGLDFNTLTVASVVIGLSELGGEGVTLLWLDAVGKRRMIWIFLGVNSLAAFLLPFTAGSLGGAMAGLGAFYITFEIVLVSAMTLMSEVVPKARATMMAATVAAFSLGRMLGDLIAPGLFGISFWASCLAVLGLNALAGVLLTQVKIKNLKTEMFN